MDREGALIHTSRRGLGRTGYSARLAASRDNTAGFRWRLRHSGVARYIHAHPIYGRVSPSGKEAIVRYCPRLL
jgi:hypothetical protein